MWTQPATADLTTLAAMSVADGSWVFVTSENERYQYIAASTITAHPTLVIACIGGGRFFRRSRRYVIANFSLWLTTVKKQVFGLTAGQLLQSGSLVPDIVLSLPNFRALGFGAVDVQGNLWLPDATLHAQGGRSVCFLLDDVLQTGTPPESIVLTGTPIADHNQSLVSFDPQGNLWRGSSTLSIGTFQRLDASVLSVTGSPAPNAVIEPAAHDWDDINKYCIFDTAGNLWYCTSVEAVPIAQVTPQIGMIAADRLASGGVLTPDKVWSGPNNFPVTAPANQGPSGLAFEPATGLLWTCAYVPGGGTIKAFDPASPSGDVAPVVTLSCATFNGPNALVFDRNGDLWVVEYDGGKLYKFGADKLRQSGTVVPDVVLTGAPSTLVAVFAPLCRDSSGKVTPCLIA